MSKGRAGKAAADGTEPRAAQLAGGRLRPGTPAGGRASERRVRGGEDAAGAKSARPPAEAGRERASAEVPEVLPGQDAFRQRQLQRGQRHPGRRGSAEGRARRGAGQGGDRCAGRDFRGGGAGEQQRAAGAAPHAPQDVPHAPVHPPPQPGGPGRGFLPGAAAAVLGHHLPVPGARRAVPRGEAPAGVRDVRVGVHAGRHDRGPLHRRVPPAQDAAAARAALAPHDRRRLGAELRAEHAAVLHLLRGRGGQRHQGPRLLGHLHPALGPPRLRDLDDERHLRGARGHPGHLLRLHLLPHLAQRPREDGAPRGQGCCRGHRQRLPQRAPARALCQQREDHFPRQDPHREDDFRDRDGLHRLLDAFLRRPDVVRLG